MAKLESIISILTLILTITDLSQCLYEDQLGLFDWKQSYIGKLTHAAFDSPKRIVIATEENVLASVSLKSGEIVWRQVLEDPAKNGIHLLDVNSQLATTVSGDDATIYIRGWEVNTGTLVYEWSLYTEKSPSKWFIHADKLVHVVPVARSHLEVTEYNTQTGQNRGTTAKITTPWMTNVDNCVLADHIWTCLGETRVYHIDLLPEGNNHAVFHQEIVNLLGEASGAVAIHQITYLTPAFVLERNNVRRLVTIKDNKLNIEPHGFTQNPVTMDDDSVVEMIGTNTIRTLNVKTGESTEIQTEVDKSATPICGICKGSACRVLLTTKDNAIHLVQVATGKTLWTREEALSGVLTVEFIDLPVDAMDASIASAFATDSNDVISMFVKRVYYQFQQVLSFCAGDKDTGDNILVRDDFGLHKLIVVATRVGKLFALDTLTGDIIWSTFIPGVRSFQRFGSEKMFLYELRTARYTEPTMILVARNVNNRGVLVTFNPITGVVIDHRDLDYSIKQLMKLPYDDDNHQKGVLLLAEDDRVYCYPETIKKALLKHVSSTFLFSTDSTKGSLNGYTLHFSSESNGIKATRTWSLHLGAATTLLDISMRPSVERVHSQGRVLGDRSVFYKYVNPNLVAVATLTSDPLHRNVLSVYLIDGVTGLVLHQAHHKRARGPVALVHSENWLVYTFTSERFRRVEMAAVELYEGARQSNVTAFSSHANSQLPHVETCSYIVGAGATPIVLAATITERGITNKHILMALSSGSVLELPWVFLQPRFATPVTPVSPDEGNYAPPYMPELPLHPEATLNYNRTLARIRNVAVAPARLESTSLVFVFGLDVFYTRVAPSKTFDVLKEDFDHWLIVMVLVGLAGASYITKKLAKRKVVKQAWK